MEKRRILAWLALIFFVALVINILFIHFYVTESVVLFLFYVLFFFFRSRQNAEYQKDMDSAGIEMENEGVREADGKEESEEKDGEESDSAPNEIEANEQQC